MILLLFLAAMLFFYSYDGKVTAYQTTLYAFSYKYGFISRAFIGTIYQGIGKLLSVDMMSYQAALAYTQVITGLFYVFMFVFFGFLLKHTEEKNIKYTELILVMYTISTVTMFACRKNFGRVDIYLVAISFAATMLLIKDKKLWLLIPMVACAMMIHQGYVFMYFNIILVLLIYRFFSAKAQGKKKYGFFFVVVFLVGSALFLYLEFFSRTNGEAIVDEIIKNAAAVSFEGDYHETLIDHEILNVDLANEEWDFHKENFVQFPIFLCFLSPFVWMLIKFVKAVFSRVTTLEDKIKYFFVCFGFLTLVPNYLLKVDYARWTYAVVSYFSIMIMALLTLKDQVISESIKEVAAVRKKHPSMILLLPYFVIFVPFWDVYLNVAMKHISDWINIFVHFM